MPTKANYERFETSPDEEFDHYLALRLGWRSVDQMRRGMSMNEWQRWSMYFQRDGQRRELARMRTEG